MSRGRTAAVVYGTAAGAGGLGLQAATALAALAPGAGALHAAGPGRVAGWPLDPEPPSLVWHAAPRAVPQWRARYTSLRWRHGALQERHDTALGQWAAGVLEREGPGAVYAFTQVGLESLRWARAAGVPAVLDSPNGHIAAFRAAYLGEARRWCGGVYHGHPTPDMVRRVEEEYALAGRIRVSSPAARESLVEAGVEGARVAVVPQPLDLGRFVPPPSRARAGPLRVCFVGTLDLRKGFVYLLRAVRALGARVELEMVGSTGDRCSRRLFEHEARGMQVRCAPGDPLPAYHRAEVMVLPSLEDGFGFVAAEAMACGLPVVVTREAGASAWVRHGETGWIVPAAREDALAGALADALARRGELTEMGRLARHEVEARGGPAAFAALREWFWREGAGLGAPDPPGRQ
ncbi:MAG TPA: glycosyltransferase family 4 protein [Longimicrobium sp.]|nr:glycosyltransferase family 4 protein [Longimicrobium sp.]